MSDDDPKRCAAQAPEPAMPVERPDESRERAARKALGWRDRWLAKLGAWVLLTAIRLLSLTWRWKVVEGEERVEELARDWRPVVFAFWHDRAVVCALFLTARYLRRGHPIVTLTSASRDGELAALVAGGLGSRIARGSSTRGGAQGLRQVLREVRSGAAVAMVPDGPKGPRHEAKPGTATIARVARIPIFPFSWHADRVWQLKSWDRLQIPKPFAKVHVAAGHPTPIARDLPDAEACRRLECDLGRLAAEVGED